MIPAMPIDKSAGEKVIIFTDLKANLFTKLKNFIMEGNDRELLDFDQLYYNLQTWKSFCEVDKQDLYNWGIMQSLIWCAERIYAGLDYDYCEMLDAPEFIRQNVEWTKSCIKLLKGNTLTNRCCQVPVILYGAGSGTGYVCSLVLEIIENGNGDIFQCPADMLVTFPNEDFAQSIYDAWLAVGKLLENSDIIGKFNGQWRLLDKHNKPLIEFKVDGRSAGGAAARGWWSLLNNTSIGEDIFVLINISDKGKLMGVSQISNKVKAIAEDQKFPTIVVADSDDLNEAQIISNNYNNVTVKLVETLDQLVKIDNISAIIENYYPSSLNILQIGESIKLGMTILNTGPVPWKFICGASLWNSEAKVIKNFEKKLDAPLKPGHQTTVEWLYTANQKGNYWLQFALHKKKDKTFKKEYLLCRKPSPSVFLISSVPFEANNPEKQESYLRNIDNICGLSPVSRSYLQETLKTYASGNFFASGIMFGITVEILVLEIWEAIVNSKNSAIQNSYNGKIEAIIDAIDKEFRNPQIGMPREMLSILEGYWPNINEQINRKHDKEGYTIALNSITPDSIHSDLLIFPELAELIHDIIRWAKSS